MTITNYIIILQKTSKECYYKKMRRDLLSSSHKKRVIHHKTGQPDNVATINYQNFGKICNRGNSSWKKEVSGWKAHLNTWKLNWKILTITGVFLDQKKINLFCFILFSLTLLHWKLWNVLILKSVNPLSRDEAWYPETTEDDIIYKVHNSYSWANGSLI